MLEGIELKEIESCSLHERGVKLNLEVEQRGLGNDNEEGQMEKERV